MNPEQYRYTPTQAPGPCPQHPACLVLRCARWRCDQTFHLPLNHPGNHAASAPLAAESPNTETYECEVITPFETPATTDTSTRETLTTTTLQTTINTRRMTARWSLV
jgi:hypothetical protein